MTDLMNPVYQVFSKDRDTHPCGYEELIFLGLAKGEEAARALAEAHAAERGVPVDHRHYSISVAPWPDPETMARSFVADCVRRGQTYGEVIKGQSGSGGPGYQRQIGGYLFEPGATVGKKLDPYEMYCRVGDEARIFDLRVLFAEESSGMRQGALL